MTRNVSKTTAKKTKGNGEFYLYLAQKNFLKKFNLHVAHVHPCLAYVHTCVNYELIKNELKLN
jgi:hypothetical protein